MFQHSAQSKKLGNPYTFIEVSRRPRIPTGFENTLCFYAHDGFMYSEVFDLKRKKDALLLTQTWISTLWIMLDWLYGTILWFLLL